MGKEKRTRNLAKRQERKAALEAEQYGYKLKGTVVKKKTDEIVLSFGNESPHQVQLQFYTALERLKNHEGDAGSYQLLYGRLLFGRSLAFDFFGDQPAEFIHDGIEILVRAVDVQIPGEKMFITKPDAEHILECLNIIDECVRKVTKVEYELNSLKFNNFLKKLERYGAEYGTVFHEEWESFKISEGWV
jgi:hypothetical protein